MNRHEMEQGRGNLEGRFDFAKFRKRRSRVGGGGLVGFFRKNILGEEFCTLEISGKLKKNILLLAPASVTFQTGSLYRSPYLGLRDQGMNAIRLDIGSNINAVRAPGVDLSYAIAAKGEHKLVVHEGEHGVRPPRE